MPIALAHGHPALESGAGAADGWTMTALHLQNPNNLLLLILPGEQDDAKALRTLMQQHRSDLQFQEQAISTEEGKQGIIRKMEENIIGVMTWIEPKAREVARS